MTSRRSFFSGFAKLAAIIALAPQIAFGVINKSPVRPEKIAWNSRKYYQASGGKWVLFDSPEDDFYQEPPLGAPLWKTEWHQHGRNTYGEMVWDKRH